MKIGKEGIKLSLSADDIMIDVEHPMKSTKKIPPRINKWVQQGWRILDQYTKINSFMITTNKWKLNFKREGKAKLDSHLQKNEIGPLSYIRHKN